MTYIEQFIKICSKTNMEDSFKEETFRYKHSPYGNRHARWFKWIINLITTPKRLSNG